MHHEHYFEQHNSMTVMRDVFVFESPLGWLGKLIDVLVLKNYLRHFLQDRCAVIKQYAETDAWREVLK
jgi:ligand-binding SRPBCC domain-containing protein